MARHAVCNIYSVRRIVLEHASGLRQILGLDADLKSSLNLDHLPVHVEPVDFLTHQGAAGLVGIKRTFVLYKEITK